MKTKYLFASLIFCAISLFAERQTAQAEDTFPIQLSLTPDIALEPRTTVIDGLSLNIWGENPQHGVALGIVNGSSDNSTGFSWGIVNYSDKYIGVNWGIVNINNDSFYGWQRGVVNVDKGRFVGYQEGFVNVSQETVGLQLALVNYASELKGVQVGIVNIAANNTWFDDFPGKLAPVFPIVNWSF